MVKNWTCYAGELDIVAVGGELVFIEVRSVQSSSFVPVSDIFPKRKHRHVVNTINNFLYKNGLLDAKWRLDLITIVLYGNSYKLIHYKNI